MFIERGVEDLIQEAPEKTQNLAQRRKDATIRNVFFILNQHVTYSGHALRVTLSRCYGLFSVRSFKSLLKKSKNTQSATEFELIFTEL